jgi:large subunit ribosomal protein L6
MSRIGKQPIVFPAGVEVSLKDRVVTVKGPKGTLTFEHHPLVAVGVAAGDRQVNVTRVNDERQSRALHGLTRALVNNMVKGVQAPFEKKLEIIGVGYQAAIKGKEISLLVGFAHSVNLPIPANVQVECLSNTLVAVRSTDKQACGQFAAEIRNVRPPEPYKGKGIKYQGEVVRRKAGKAFGS